MMRARVGTSLTAVIVAVVFAVGARAADEMLMFPVPTVTVHAGQTLTEEILGERRLYANAVARRTHFTERAGVIGKVAARTIPAGAAIAQSAVRDPHAFKEGSRVTLLLSRDGLTIETAGIALGIGVPGRPARVRISDTGVIVTGVVKADGSVEIEK